MKYALVAIERQQKGTLRLDDLWHSYLETLQTKISSNEGIETLNETLLLLPLDETLLVLAEVVRTCNAAGYQSKVLFFEEKPSWITS